MNFADGVFSSPKTNQTMTIKEVGQFTYFQQVGGIPVTLPSFEMTYGLERLAMYVQDVENVFALDFNGAGRPIVRRRVSARRTRIQHI